MGYVAVKGGAEAIREAARALELVRAAAGGPPLDLAQIEHQLHFLHGRVMSEGGLADPVLVALAIKQALGDPLEAALYLRAYRSTRPRLAETLPSDTGRMRLVRRISAAFKEVPGGQMLGATPDYLHRLFRFELLEEDRAALERILADWLAGPVGELPGPTAPKVLDALRAEGLVPPLEPSAEPAFDITRTPLTFPVPRSAALAIMARGETGGLLTLAYSKMRGYGDIHPTVGELRVGYLPVELPHPVTGEPVEVGEVLLTECEIVAMFTREGKGPPRFTVGYGACLGHNEVKAIAMAVLDRAMTAAAAAGPKNPSEDPDFVLLHVDGIEAQGFCIHYKMPHYVTFQSDMDRLRRARAEACLLYTSP
ncbi:MAG: carbon-phosphorus lyase complex subunit PhnI, partial [Geminicoccaceae bacterium]|nr:carbon-phosphorus lyase complex subunit PhnI [Geminicoccaceae bacterium]